MYETTRICWVNDGLTWSRIIQMNRLQCLRLTEHAADNLLSVRQEVHDAGDEVGHELAVPYKRLLECVYSAFHSFVTLTLTYQRVHKVLDFLLKQVHRPWIKCYLKQDEILGMIDECGQNGVFVSK
jgi:abelson tyrosine-protein kinase 1